MIGNKCDLNEERVIPIEKGEQLHNDYNLDLFLETSAKSGINTELLFAKAAKLLYNDYVKYKIGNPLIGRGKSTKKLKNDDKNEKKEKKNILKKKKKNEKDEDNEKLLEKKRKKNK